LLGLGSNRSDISVLLLSMVIFHCLLPGFHPIGWLGPLLLLLVSVLFHSFRLGVLRGEEFLVLGSTYPLRFSAAEENGRVRPPALSPLFNKFPCFQKSDISVSHDLVDFLLFLIPGYLSLFALRLPLKFRHFNTKYFMFTSPREKHFCFFVQNLLM
jgi:hypothetical protein